MLAISIILPADDIHTLSVDKDFTDDMVWRLRFSTLKCGQGKGQGYGMYKIALDVRNEVRVPLVGR